VGVSPPKKGRQTERKKGREKERKNTKKERKEGKNERMRTERQRERWKERTRERLCVLCKMGERDLSSTPCVCERGKMRECACARTHARERESVCLYVCTCAMHVRKRICVLSHPETHASAIRCVAVCCSVLQCVAVCCNVLQCITRDACIRYHMCCGVLQSAAECCSVLQCVARGVCIRYYSLFLLNPHPLLSLMQFDRKNPPPRGGFLFTMFPDQEPGGRGPPVKNHPQN